MADAKPAVRPRRRRMTDDMMLGNLSPATQRSYLIAGAKFSLHFDRSAQPPGLENVRACQVYLVPQGIPSPSLGRRVCALRLFCGVSCQSKRDP